jgi:hypothetical protein
MADETNETDVPYAPGLDEWHALANRTSAADKATAEKAAIAAEDFQQTRAERAQWRQGTILASGLVNLSTSGLN